MQLLQLVLGSALFSSPSPTTHLLVQLEGYEKTIESIDHLIAKAEYNEKNPPPTIIFGNFLPLDWFPHTCESECREDFVQTKKMLLELHAASAQNKFKEVIQTLKENPELTDFVDDHGNTILHHATKGKHANLTLALLCIKPALITIKNKQNQTPLDLTIMDNPRKIGLFVRVAYAKI